jgi:putative peptidoglycan lipid II flippase
VSRTAQTTEPGKDGVSHGPQHLGRHFRTVSIATAISRVTGFIRDCINGQLFGAGWISDSYFMAIRIPSMLRDLFAEGALSSAFIPTFSRSLEKEGQEDAWKLMTQVFTLLLLVVGLIVGLGILFTPSVVNLIAHGFLSNPEKFRLTVALTRVLFPVLMFVSLAALWMGCLNAHHKFNVPAFAPVAMNVTLILAGAYLLYFRPATTELEELSNMRSWTLATTVGMLFQWLVQVPSLRKLGWSFRFSFPPTHPGVFEMLVLMAPAVISQSVLQVNLLIDQFFASYLPHGGISCLYYGNRLMQLPYGVFGVSIATVVFPLLSRQAAKGDRAAMQTTLSRAIEAAAFITIPCMVGLALTAEPITVLAFQRGKFDAQATALVTQATALYVSGLFFYSSNKILVPTFYALQRPKWPLNAALCAMGADLFLNLAAFLFIDDMHLRFLALPTATIFSGFVNFSLLMVGLRRYEMRFDYRDLFRELGKVLAATAIMAVAVWGTLKGMDHWTLPGMKVWKVFLPIAIGVGLYFYLSSVFACRGRLWIRHKGSV